MTRTFGALTLILSLGLAPAASGQELSAKEIVDRMLQGDYMAFDQGHAVVRMTLENKRGKQRIRKVESRGRSVNGLRTFVVTFLEPDDVAGTQMLSIERKGQEDLQYLYLASMKDKRLIAGSDKNDSFMGTDFTYADMEQRDIEDSTWTRLPDEEVSGIPAYHVVSQTLGKETSYGKVEVWIDRKDFLPLKVYYYDRKGALLKKLIAQQIEPKGGKLTITRLLMKNVQKETKTLIEMLSLDRTATFPDAIFSPDNLGK